VWIAGKQQWGTLRGQTEPRAVPGWGNQYQQPWGMTADCYYLRYLTIL